MGRGGFSALGLERGLVAASHHKEQLAPERKRLVGVTPTRGARGHPDMSQSLLGLLGLVILMRHVPFGAE